MSFRRLLDRTVTIVPRAVTGTDARGNDVITDGTPVEGVPAARDLKSTDEEHADRDQVNRRWDYFLPAFLDDGTPVTIDAYAHLIDAGETLDLVGVPELVTRRRRPHRAHHWELVAERRA